MIFCADCIPKPKHIGTHNTLVYLLTLILYYSKNFMACGTTIRLNLYTAVWKYDDPLKLVHVFYKNQTRFVSGIGPRRHHQQLDIAACILACILLIVEIKLQWKITKYCPVFNTYYRFEWDTLAISLQGDTNQHKKKKNSSSRRRSKQKTYNITSQREEWILSKWRCGSRLEESRPLLWWWFTNNNMCNKSGAHNSIGDTTI